MARYGTDELETDAGTPCARGNHCAEAARVVADDGSAYREPACAPAVFCLTDTSIIRRCIREVPKVYGVLIRFTGIKVTAEQPVHVPFGPSVPIRLDVDEIARLIVDAVMTWHERLTAAAGLAPVATKVWREDSLDANAASLLPHPSEVLAANLSVLLALEPEWMRRPSSSPAARLACGEDELGAWTAHGGQWDSYAGGVHAGTEFMRLDYLARAAMGLIPAHGTNLLGVECANQNERHPCSQRALRLADPPQHEGDPAYFSQCAACGHLMTEDEYRQWTERHWSWWSARLAPAQIAARSGHASQGGLTEGAVLRLIAAAREARPVLGATPAA